ncbi:MAG TPA: hypothetical protein VFE32_11085 [Puia sp.]|jgi:hypothetical protein|nr:hypothetical protein [Puia sp.]
MTNPLDLDPITFLRQKIAYHIAQVQHHNKMANDTAEKLEFLLAGTKGAEDFHHFADQHNDLPDGSDFTDSNGNKCSVTYWKPKVEDFLRHIGGYAKTTDIFMALESSSQHTPTERRKIVTAISCALYYLVENQKVEKAESDGRGNSYKWKG